jgi:hypothetical protein
MGTPLAANVVNLSLVVAVFLIVVVSFFVLLGSRKQVRVLELTQDLVKQNQVLVQQCQVLAEQGLGFARQSRELVREDRRYQNCPVIVPLENLKGPMGLYDAKGNIQWTAEDPIRVDMQNMGLGPAFNVHCVLYGPERLFQHQFVSWGNGPIRKDKVIHFEHSRQFRLSRNDSIDGVYPLYDESPDSLSGSTIDRVARLTITYHDISGNRYVSIYDYTKEKKWIKVEIRETPSIDGKPPIDLKELNTLRQQ